MLVLSRKIGQSIIIGNNVRIKIVEIRGQQVRLGVEAPDDVAIVREEIHNEIADVNRGAVEAPPAEVEKIARALRRSKQEDK